MKPEPHAQSPAAYPYPMAAAHTVKRRSMYPCHITVVRQHAMQGTMPTSGLLLTTLMQGPKVNPRPCMDPEQPTPCCLLLSCSLLPTLRHAAVLLQECWECQRQTTVL